ncbi:MAG TPA: prenyltransferase/squalene oxidase repeat-containing protein [Gemmataceae bacterium]|nr:prenyltransferase/squalene oxidase repeat-containing protein [Gemmataceae bacterium]
MKTKPLLVAVVIGAVAAAAWYMYRPSRQTSPVAEPPPPLPPVVEQLDKDPGLVAKGLAFIAKRQSQDGHWEDEKGEHPVAMTGFVGIAMLMENDARAYKQRTPKHAASLQKAVDWLLKKSKPERDGLIFSEHPSETSRYMEGHGLATMFLAGARKSETDEGRRAQLTQILTSAVKYIGKAQSAQGGWYHTSKVEGHDFDAISVTTIQIQALQAAAKAGIPLPANVLENAQEYMRRAAENETSSAPVRLATTIRAAACRFNRIAEGDSDLRKKWIGFIKPKVKSFGSDNLNYYYYAQALFVGLGSDWIDYRDLLQFQLKDAQFEDGSWPGNFGASSVHGTALWCTVLQLEGENYPSMMTARSSLVD